MEKVLNAHDSGIWSVIWNAGGEVLTGSMDERVKVWTEEGQAAGVLEGHRWGVVGLSRSADGGRVVASSMDGHVRVWDGEAKTLLRDIDASPVDAWTVACSPDGGSVAGGSRSGSVHVWSTGSGEREASWDAGTAFQMAVAWSDDGRLVASAGADGALSLFGADSGRKVHSVDAHARPVRGLCFLPGSSALASASDDGAVHVYDVAAECTLSRSLGGHESWAVCVASDVSGALLASGSTDRSIRVWDLRANRCAHVLSTVHEDTVWGIAFSPTGTTRIASVSEDKSLAISQL